MRHRWTIAAYVIVAVAWMVIRVSVFSQLRVIEFPDSKSFLAKAAEPLWTGDYFFGSGRFFVVPLFYKIVFVLSAQKAALAVAQLLLAIGAWLTFAWTLAARIRPAWLSVATLAAVLAFALGSEIIQWDVMVLSESISTSLFVLLVAVWIRLAEGLSTARVTGVIAAAALWSMSREANSLLVLPLAAAIMIWGVWYLRGRQRDLARCGMVAGGLAVVFLGTFAISASGGRWVFPLLNVIGTRVLPSPDRTAFYQAHGMPVNAALMNLSGEFASGQDWAFYLAPQLEDFRAWLRVNGQTVFVKDLASHPVRTVAEPMPDVNEFVCPALSPYRYDPFATVYPNFDEAWFCQPGPARAIVVGSLVVGVVLFTGAWLLRRRLQPSDGFRVLTVGALLLGWLPFTWFTWHAIGGMEVGRHVWSGVFMSRIGAILLLYYLALAASRRWLSRSAT